MPGSATCSRTCSRACCRRCRRRGARARGGASRRGRRSPLGSAHAWRRRPERFRGSSCGGAGRARGRRRPVARPSVVECARFRVAAAAPPTILLLLARRLREEAAHSQLEGAIEGDRVERLSVGPLSLGARSVLRPRLGRVSRADASTRARDLRRKPILRTRARPRSARRRHRPDATTPRPRNARRTGTRPPRWTSAHHPPSAAARVGGRASIRGASRGLRRYRGRARTRARGAGDRARRGGDSLHAPAALISGVPRRVRGRATACASTRCAGRRRADLCARSHLALSTERPDPEIAAALEDAAALAKHARRTHRRR